MQGKLVNSNDYYQLVMMENSGHFGKQVGDKWTTLWEIYGTMDIEFGQYEVNVEANSTHTSLDIPFKRLKTNTAPFLIITPVAYIHPNDIDILVLSVTSQRMLLRIVNNSSIARDVIVYWMAIIKK